jgi:trimeric autotransporter adhesin
MTRCRDVLCSIFSIVAIGLATPLVLQSAAHGAVAPGQLWGTNERVLAIAPHGNTLYIGGTFTKVWPCVGGMIATDRTIGTQVPGLPRVNGTVSAIASDAEGGWYVGGTFNSIDGLPRSNLGHILSNGRVSSWAPRLDGGVYALATSGGAVVVGGAFQSVDGRASPGLAIFDANGHGIGSWNVSGPTPPCVSALAIQNSTLYIGGSFSSINQTSRSNAAALSLATRAILPWDPAVDGPVYALALTGGSIFLGGDFTRVNGAVRIGLAEVNEQGAVQSIDLGLQPIVIPDNIGVRVRALLVRNATLYVGGRFAEADGETRRSLCAIDLARGALLPWNPGPDWTGRAPEVDALSAGGSDLLFGGYFDTVGGVPRGFSAEVDAAAGSPTPWSPQTNGAVLSIASDASRVCLGGGFTSAGAPLARSGLAAIDLTTGAPTGWDPSPDNFPIVYSLAVVGPTIYAGGIFQAVGGQVRLGLAAIDSTTGQPTSWDPQCDGAVTTMAVRNNRLYVGGGFGSIGGVSRNNAAAFDLTTGLLTPWDPNALAEVRTVVEGDSTIYVGGDFYTIGGHPQHYLAEVDTAVGTVTSWAPQLDSGVETLAVAGQTLYAGGAFSSINGQPRTNLGAIDRRTGAATGWAPTLLAALGDSYPSVYCMIVRDSALYVGGAFAIATNDEDRLGAAAFDVDTGAPMDWHPDPYGQVWSLAYDDASIYIGGAFSRTELWPSTSLALVPPVEQNLDPPFALHTLQLAQNIPNPARDAATIRYSLPSATTVRLTIYDLQGRKIAEPASGESQPAGDHEVLVRTQGWRAGMYFYRLDAGGASASRKMLVL